MKLILGYLRPHRRGLVIASVALTVSTFCDLLLPTIMSDILNNGIYPRDFTYIAECCALMLIITILGLSTTVLGIWQSSRVVAGFCADVRSQVFSKVHRMRIDAFGKMGTAALVTRATHDVETVSWLASELAGTVATIPMLFFGGVILAMRKDMLLSLVMLAFIPVILAVVLVIGRKIVPLWEQADEYIDKQNEMMRQRLRGIRVIRAFQAEEKEHQGISKATRDMAEIIIKSNISMELITPFASFLLNFAAVLIVYLGGWQMERGYGLSGGDIFAIVQYIALVAGSVLMGAFSILMFPHARVAADRISQVLSAEGEMDTGEKTVRVLTGEIRMERVTFSYPGAAAAALRDISLHIQPGQKIAVIGGTGAGKSTLISLLLGFRQAEAGEIWFDGIPVSSLSLRTLRENISCVLQNPSIYSGTVQENIQMGKSDANEEEIAEALEVSQARAFVEAFPEGTKHEIQQSGKNLSGGQKQRLSIARAVLKEAPIYIFDDSFSALDFLTEAKLRAALGKKLFGKTQILITQRVTSAMHCDRIFVMDSGCLADSGTHEELLSRCQVYREIYASQTGGAQS